MDVYPGSSLIWSDIKIMVGGRNGWPLVYIMFQVIE